MYVFKYSNMKFATCRWSRMNSNAY